VREFVNTYDVEDDVDALRTPDDLVRWLRHQKLLAGAGAAADADLARGADLARAVDLARGADLARAVDLARGADLARAVDLARALDLREAIRELLAANHDGAAGPTTAAAAQVLSATARRARLRIRFEGPTGYRLAPESRGIDAGLGELLVIITAAMNDGRWRRLKVCRNDTCRWAFFDTSRAGTGKWCSMAVCGNRRKAQAWRARQRTTARPS
jgi:predicted RNA-binding Zn ribbon-like protein